MSATLWVMQQCIDKCMYIYTFGENTLLNSSSYASDRIKILQKTANEIKKIWIFRTTNMRMCSNCKQHCGHKWHVWWSCKNNKKLCSLEHFDLLFAKIRLILFFLHRPVHISLLVDFWHAIRTHVHVHCSTKKIQIFLNLFAIFSEFFNRAWAYELGSRKTTSPFWAELMKLKQLFLCLGPSPLRMECVSGRIYCFFRGGRIYC
jgi:hypothetical protein